MRYKKGTLMEIKQPRAGKEGKTYWHKVGVKFLWDDGKESIKLDSLPLPNEKGEVWMNLFEQSLGKMKELRVLGISLKRLMKRVTIRTSKDFDDEIPF